MATFANKSCVKKQRVKYFFVYIVHPFSISSASPSNSLFFGTFFSSITINHKDNKANNFFRHFCLANLTVFGLFNYGRENKKRCANTFKLTFFAKYLRKNGDVKKNTKWWLQIGKFANKKIRRIKIKNHVQFQAIYVQILEFFLTRFGFFPIQLACMWMRSRQ